MTRNATAAAAGGVRLRWRVLSLAAIWLLIVYLGLVLPLDKTFPVMNRWLGVGLLLVVSLALTIGALKWWLWRGPNAGERTRNALLLATMTLGSLLAGDIAFTALANLNPAYGNDSNQLITGREQDAHVWNLESMPRKYRPTSANFTLYKPEQTEISTVYGELYYPDLLRHKIMRDSVLALRRVTFVIDKYGLRNTDDPSTARIFALGDSFCFGYHTTQEAVLTTHLKARLGEPVYNLGIPGTSPMQQYLLLEHMMRTAPDAFRPHQLLWLLFEGNDLEESYDVLAPAPASGLRKTFDGTIVGAAANLPGLIRQELVIHRVTGGNGELSSRSPRGTKLNHHELDGQVLASPIYHSPRFGYRLFHQPYIDRAAQPESYVRNHPNLPRLADAFRRMKALAQERGFDVTIVIVPSDVRLYKNHFEDFPAISKEPHFIDHIKRLADETGFKRLDLLELLAPYAEHEMIHYRDDTHWNERGHEIVAEILGQRAMARARTPTARPN